MFPWRTWQVHREARGHVHLIGNWAISVPHVLSRLSGLSPFTWGPHPLAALGPPWSASCAPQGLGTLGSWRGQAVCGNAGHSTTQLGPWLLWLGVPCRRIA